MKIQNTANKKSGGIDLELIVFIVIVTGFVFIAFTIFEQTENQKYRKNCVWKHTTAEVNPFDRKSTNYLILANLDGWVEYCLETNTSIKFTNNIKEFKKGKQFIYDTKPRHEL